MRLLNKNAMLKIFGGPIGILLIIIFMIIITA